jgi:hypothetical protein
MTISVLNGGGIVRKGGALFRVLIVLAIVVQGGLVAHHASEQARQVHVVQHQTALG